MSITAKELAKKINTIFDAERYGAFTLHELRSIVSKLDLSKGHWFGNLLITYLVNTPYIDEENWNGFDVKAGQTFPGTLVHHDSYLDELSFSVLIQVGNMTVYLGDKEYGKRYYISKVNPKFIINNPVRTIK